MVKLANMLLAVAHVKMHNRILLGVWPGVLIASLSVNHVSA